MPTIMPIRDLRKTSEISELAHKKQEPIFITKNGYSDLVVMSSELYEVMLYPRAYRDIHDIYAYIALERLSPETAKEQTDRIWQAIKKLELFPKSHQDRLVGRYAGKEYKQLIIDNYIAIFKVDENKKKVFVLTVQYQGRQM